MSKHAPGPWAIEFDGDEQPRRIVDRDGEHVTYIDGSRYHDNREDPEALANCALIAAAPELLSALKDCLEGMAEQGVELCEHIAVAKARAAIAKAEGK